MNNRLLNTPIPPATTISLGRMVLPALDPWTCAVGFFPAPVGIIVGVVLHGHSVTTVVFSTRVLTTPLVVIVENWRRVGSDSARTNEKSVQKATRATKGDESFIEI